jgi:glutathione S-transferase
MQAIGRGPVGPSGMGETRLAQATLTISSKNYSSWSLRGWLLAKMSGLDFREDEKPLDDPSSRAELLLLSPSMLVPCLEHDGLTIWNNLAIGEYLHEIHPEAGLLPSDRARRARCRSISGEMHSGFAPLRSALPMNIKGDFPTFKVWSRAQADIDRITTIWRDCIADFGGPYLIGERPCMADAMFAPVATRLKTYHVQVDSVSAAYRDLVLDMPAMREWIAAAKAEPVDIDELEVEF